MSIENNIENELVTPQQIEGNKEAIDQKLSELEDMLAVSDIDDKTAASYQLRFDRAIKKEILTSSFDQVSDDFSILLSKNPYNAKLLKQYLQSELVSKIVLIAIGGVMILMGMGMIIMPAPPFFEMYTIFYFNQNDGITVMDLISLLVVLAGVYFLIKGIYWSPELRRFTRERLKSDL